MVWHAIILSQIYLWIFIQEVLGQTKQKLQCHHPSPLQNKLGEKKRTTEIPRSTGNMQATFGKINPHFLVNEKYKHLGFLCFINVHTFKTFAYRVKC